MAMFANPMSIFKAQGHPDKRPTPLVAVAGVTPAARWGSRCEYRRQSRIASCVGRCCAAVTATMTTAAYQHILTAGLIVYVQEFVVLCLGGRLALLLNGPVRFSFDAAMGPELISSIGGSNPSPESAMPSSSGTLIPAAIPVESFNGAR